MYLYKRSKAQEKLNMLLTATVLFLIWKNMINFTEQGFRKPVHIVLLPELYFKRQSYNISLQCSEVLN